MIDVARRRGNVVADASQDTFLIPTQSRRAERASVDRGESILWRRLTVVTAWSPQPSHTRLLADCLTEATLTALAARRVRAEVAVVDVREHMHDLTIMLDTGLVTPDLGTAFGAVTRADGLIALHPTADDRSGSNLPAFIRAIPVADAAATGREQPLTGLPVLLGGATGGTARQRLALEHSLRPLFLSLNAVPLRSAVFGAAEDLGAGPAEAAGLRAQTRRAAGELARLMRVRAPRRRVAMDLATPVTQRGQASTTV
jgi:FMN reductase